MSELYEPGEIPLKGGAYIEVASDGGRVKDPRVITIEPGDKPFPTTRVKGNKWARIGPVIK